MLSEIQSDKVVLRRYQKEFAPLLFEAALESRNAEFMRWMPWCHQNYAMHESEDFIQRSIQGWEEVRQFEFAIFDPRNGEFCGGVGLNQRNELYRFYNLGYWIRVSCQKKGFASHATKLLAQTAFKELPINRIEIVAARENTASRKTAERAGAEFEGILRQRLVVGKEIHDAALFSFVRADFHLT